MKIKLMFFVLMFSMATSVHAASRSLNEYSLQTKQVALMMLRNPELRKTLFAQEKAQQKTEEKGWWQTVTGWFGL